uniref:Uncharacterized protein n=1 Tax=Rhizophora mucronata TaxID=61149 RepID=A0A2P2QTF4_RHIMU
MSSPSDFSYKNFSFKLLYLPY